MYDAVAGTQGLTLSRYVTPSESRRQFATLSPAREDGHSLKGTVRDMPGSLQYQHTRSSGMAL